MTFTKTGKYSRESVNLLKELFKERYSNDYKNKIVYEVKPKSMKEDEKVAIKETAAIEWCKINGWEFRFISDNWITDNKEDIARKMYLIDDTRTEELIRRYL